METEKRNKNDVLTNEELFHIAHNISLIYYRKNDLENCKIYVEQVLKIHPENIAMLEKLSYLLMREEKVEEQSKIDQKLFFSKA